MANFKSNITTENIPDDFLFYLRSRLQGLTHGELVIKVHDSVIKYVDKNEKDKIECHMRSVTVQPVQDN